MVIDNVVEIKILYVCQTKTDKEIDCGWSINPEKMINDGAERQSD